MTRFIFGMLVGVLGALASAQEPKPEGKPDKQEARMRLGNFSISLAVKDIKASQAFYEKLGFRTMGFGDPSQNWLILQNGTATIGLFQGMFEKNTMTFNPGWDSSAKPLADFDDVRAIQKDLESKGVKLTMKADASSTGPASIMLADPDGNPILVDQHVPKPAK